MLNPAQCAVADHLADTPERERYVDALVKARSDKGPHPHAEPCAVRGGGPPGGHAGARALCGRAGLGAL